MLLPRLRPMSGGHCQVCTGRGWRWRYLILLESGGSVWVCAQCRLHWWRYQMAKAE